MKKIIYASIFLAITNQLFASKTLLIPRSVTTDATHELTLTYYQDTHHKKDKKFTCSFMAVPFYQASADQEKIAQYLLPYNSTNLSVREDGLGTVGSPWLYLITAQGSRFNSSVCIKPQFEKVGVLLGARFNLDNITRGLWFSALLTPLQAINKLNACEIQNGATGALSGYSSVLQALNNYCTQFWCTKTKKGGLDDIQLKMGYSFRPIKDRLNVEGYLVGIIPTSPKPQACYFFEPIVGNGGHGGLGFGLSGFVDGKKEKIAHWSWLFDVKYWYLFSNTQARAFDLTNGDWTRYLLGAFEEVPELGFPLLPLLVRCAKVTPGSQLSLWQALHYQHNHLHAEFGASFWYRQQEHMCLGNVNFGTLGIYDLLGMRLGIATSASQATIDQTSGSQNSVKSDTTFKKLTAGEINCCSAAQPRAYTFKFFGSIGYGSTERIHPLLAGLSAFYEVANSSSALSQWGILAKLGVNF